jgi:hypothetical protein
MSRAALLYTLALGPSLLLAASTGCKETASPPASSSAPVVASSVPVVASTAGSAGPATAAPAGSGACDLRWGFHGTVAGQEVFLRLKRDGGALAGRYLYAKVGRDLALAGTIDGAGKIDLAEGDRAKPSGHFAGTCAGGVLDGTWSDAGKTAPFHLEAVTARPTPLVATRKLSVSHKPKKGAPGGKECKYEQSVAEIYGAGTPEAELAVNQQPVDVVPFFVDKGQHDAVKACEEGLEVSFDLGVIATFRGLLTTQGGGSVVAEGAAHPANGEGFHRETWVLATGHKVTEADVFSSFPEAILKRCAPLAIAAVAGSTDPSLVEILTQHRSIDLTPAGVRVWAADYGHAMGVLTGEGPVLTWGALLKAGALRADSPARSAWEGMAPAGPKDPECVDANGKRLH